MEERNHFRYAPDTMLSYSGIQKNIDVSAKVTLLGKYDSHRTGRQRHLLALPGGSGPEP